MSTSKRLLISANNNNNHLNKISLSLPPAPAPFIDDHHHPEQHAVTINGGGIKTYISVHNGEIETYVLYVHIK